nr:MAG TPA: hypothetical protein [Caudoviricetes sp.]
MLFQSFYYSEGCDSKACPKCETHCDVVTLRNTLVN